MSNNNIRLYLYGIDAPTIQRFTDVCEDAGVNRSVVIEALMNAVIEGRFLIGKQPAVVLTDAAANELADAETAAYLEEKQA